MNNEITLMVDGEEVTLDVTSDTSIDEALLADDMARIAPTLAWYGRLKASAQAHLSRKEDEHKAFRAKFLSDLMVQEPKIAEWKARKRMEAERRYRHHVREVIDAQELVDRLTSAYQALKVKADMLRSIGAAQRQERAETR